MVRALVAAGVRVLVIDDNSPTAPVRWRTNSPRSSAVDVLHRERKEGLGPAYLAGFRRALADGAELILEMDCDFSRAEGRRALTARAEEEPTSCSARATCRGRSPTGAAAPLHLAGGCVYTALAAGARA